MTKREKEKKIVNACLTCKLNVCRNYDAQCQLKKVRKEIQEYEKIQRNAKRKKTI